MCQNRWEPIACDLLPEEKKTRSVENPKREAKRRQKFAGVGVTVSEKNLALTQKWMRGKVSASSYWASRLRVISQCIADKKPDGECVFFLSVAPCVCLQPPLPPPRAPLLLLIFFVRRCEVVMSFHPGTVSCVETDLLCKPLRELLGQEERISSEKFPQNLNARRRSRRVPQKC